MRFVLLIASLLVAAPAVAQSPQVCRYTLRNANVWTGSEFARRDLHVDGTRLAGAAPAGARGVDAGWMYLIPPLVDTHTHGLDEPAGPDDPQHRKHLDLGIFYALNPNNIRRESPGAPFGPDQVETIYAGGGITGPGGHPRPLYEGLARAGILGPISAAQLPGRAFHEAGTPAAARAAVERVQAAGSPMVKLYLLSHDRPGSAGLTAAAFRAAVAHARARGLRSIVHVETAADFRLAVAERVAALMHMPGTSPRPDDADSLHLLTAADAALAAKNRVMVVPTTAVAFAAYTGERLARAQRIQRHNLQLLRDAGVVLTAGADRYGATALDELAQLRATTLFDGTQMLNMATANGARFLFPDRKVGSLEPDAEASFLILTGDPRTSWYSLAGSLGGLRAGSVIFDRTGLLRGLCQPAAAP